MCWMQGLNISICSVLSSVALYEAEAYAMGHLFTSLSELAAARSVVSPLDTSLTHSVAALFGCKRAIRKFDFVLYYFVLLV